MTAERFRYESEIFAALGDPSRLRIVDLLREGGDLRIKDIAANFGQSRQAVTKHLDILDRAGVIGSRKVGRERLFCIVPTALQDINAWLARYERFWDDRLLALKTMIEEGEGDQ